MAVRLLTFHSQTYSSVGLFIQKILFPVQRVAIIPASRAASIFFNFFTYFLNFVGKYCPFLEGKKIKLIFFFFFFFKVCSRTF